MGDVWMGQRRESGFAGPSNESRFDLRQKPTLRFIKRQWGAGA